MRFTNNNIGLNRKHKMLPDSVVHFLGHSLQWQQLEAQVCAAWDVFSAVIWETNHEVALSRVFSRQNGRFAKILSLILDYVANTKH